MGLRELASLNGFKSKLKAWKKRHPVVNALTVFNVFEIFTHMFVAMLECAAANLRPGNSLLLCKRDFFNPSEALLVK